MPWQRVRVSHRHVRNGRSFVYHPCGLRRPDVNARHGTSCEQSAALPQSDQSHLCFCHMFPLVAVVTINRHALSCLSFVRLQMAVGHILDNLRSSFLPIGIVELVTRVL